MTIANSWAMVHCMHHILEFFSNCVFLLCTPIYVLWPPTYEILAFDYSARLFEVVSSAQVCGKVNNYVEKINSIRIRVNWEWVSGSRQCQMSYFHGLL